MSFTSKYSFEKIAYSVTGWNALITNAMQKIDDQIPTRIREQLNEAVSAYEALYVVPGTSKFGKAQADGTKQPCVGLSTEAGILNATINIHRDGEITNAGWSWTPGDPIYLSAVTAGALTQTEPHMNKQVVAVALSATKILWNACGHVDPGKNTTTTSTTTTTTTP